MHPDWDRRFDATPARPEATPIPELPWTLWAWERAVMGNNVRDLQPWTASAVAKEAPPPLAIFHSDPGGWRTLDGIASPSAQSSIKHYAMQHGHTIPQEVLDGWEFQAESQRLVEKVTDEAKRFATSMAPALRTEAELMRWVGNRLGDLARELEGGK